MNQDSIPPQELKSKFSQKEAVLRCLLLLYSYQTLEEKNLQHTIESNGVGFNGLDAKFCTSVSRKILDGRYFTDKQSAAIAPILVKYHAQVTEMGLKSIDIPSTALTKPEPKPKSKFNGKLCLTTEQNLKFFPYTYPSTQIKQLGFSGRKVDGTFFWFAPYSLDKAEGAIKMFDPVEIDESLREVLAEVDKLNKLPEWIENHEFAFDFQKEAVQFLHKNSKAMLALAPGLGKTLVGILAAASIPDPTKVLVVVPKSLMYNWKEEVSKWLGPNLAQICYGNPSDWEMPVFLEGTTTFAITNYDTLRLQQDAFSETDWGCLIVDESIMIKNRKAKRTKIVKAVAENCKHVWLLTGAPTTRFYDDLWAQFNVLDHQRFRSYWRFARTYCELEESRWGTSIVGNKPGSAKSIQSDFRDIYFSRTQDQVLDLPDWLFETISVPMSDEDYEPYDTMLNTLVAQLDADTKITAPNILTQILRLIQIASSPSVISDEIKLSQKWQACLDLLEYKPLPAIIWTNFIKTAETMCTIIEAAGKYKVGVLTGKTAPEDRQEIVNKFQAGELDIIIAHPAVGKFGYTLTKARTAIYLERSFNGDDYFQSVHRVRRIGTEHSPLVIHLLSTTPSGGRTIDHQIDKVLDFRKEANIELTTNMLQEICNE